jgi:hypothetical protein
LAGNLWREVEGAIPKQAESWLALWGGRQKAPRWLTISSVGPVLAHTTSVRAVGHARGATWTESYELSMA